MERVYADQGEDAMPIADASAAQEAVSRLFDLSRAGSIDNIEFNQLDSLVYARLLETYARDVDGGIDGGGSTP
jgi:hypothetical protein